MNRKRTALLLALLFTLLAVPVLADQVAGASSVIASLIDRPGILVRVLHLSSSQADTLKGLIQTLQNTVKPLHTANQQLDKQIQTALGSPAPDNCAIGKLVVTRHQNELAIAAAFTKFDHDFSAILSPDQLTRYEHLKHLLSHSGHDEDAG